MTIRIVKKDSQKTANWSGGTTTELFIYPPDTSYERKEFLFRISTALCTQEESTFTILPGTRRILMPLDGNLRLQHAGRPPVDLAPGMCDAFSGEEITRSCGSCRDFNLMLRGAALGSMCYYRLRAGERILVPASAGAQLPADAASAGQQPTIPGQVSAFSVPEPVFTGLYLWKGAAVLETAGGAPRNLQMKAGDFALLSYETDTADTSSCSVCVTAAADAVLAAAFVWEI